MVALALSLASPGQNVNYFLDTPRIFRSHSENYFLFLEHFLKLHGMRKRGNCLLVKSFFFHFYCLCSTRLKQQYPVVFQDICLYSEVSHRMGSATYRLSARRFLQELFLDLQFDAVSTAFQTLLHIYTYPSSTTCHFMM